MNDEHILAKLMVGLFIFELIGILLTLASVGSNTPTLSGFNAFAGTINASTQSLYNFKNAAVLTTVTVSCPIDPVVCGLDDIYNAIVWVVNVVDKFFTLAIGIGELILEMIGLIGYIFIILLPSLFISTGLVGYIMGWGYIFLIILLAYKFGKYVIAMFGAILHFIQGFIP